MRLWKGRVIGLFRPWRRTSLGQTITVIRRDVTLSAGDVTADVTAFFLEVLYA